MTTDRRTQFAWFSTVVILLLCLWPQSGFPRDESLKGFPHADKVIHFAMFAAFGILWMRAGRAGGAAKGAKVFAAALALGVATELLQGVPILHRDPDVLDVLADSLGAVFGVGLVLAAESYGMWGAEEEAPEG